MGEAILRFDDSYPNDFQVPVRVGVAVFFPPVGRGINKGHPPEDGGDWDNYLKAVLDAAIHFGVIKNDSPRWFRGPAMIR